MMNWDDLQYILAVHEHGSAIAAAKKLGVNPTTIQRRIIGFEEAQSVHLFERRPSGYTATSECLALIDEVRLIRDSTSRISREILGRDLRLEGRIAVTSTESIINQQVALHIRSFRQQHPDIDIELTLTNTRLNLSRQDADVAIRPSLKPQDTLVGQNVCKLVFAIYGTPELLSMHFEGEPEFEMLNHELPWLGLGDALSGSPAYAWMRDHVSSGQVRVSSDTFSSVATLAEQGLGLALLPCMVGDARKGLKRLHIPGLNVATPIWVLTHPEIKNAARIKAFTSHIARALRSDRAMIEGWTS